MKSRTRIKQQAKAVLKQNYGMCLAPYLVFGLVAVVASGITLGIGSILILPIAVGVNLIYFMLWTGETPSLGDMFTSAFRENYLRKMGGMFLVGLYTVFWTCLFIVPGMIKTYSYCMTPYLLAKFPNLTANQAITVSRKIMDTRKLDLFVADFSFYFWHLLGVLTLGILEIFYIVPYVNVTRAGYFVELVNDALEDGRITRADLGIEE